MKQTLSRLLDENGSLLGRKIGLFIQFLIVLSLVSFTVETLPDLSGRMILFLSILEVVIVVIFTVEYLARIYAAPDWRQYAFSFWGITDLVAILPFYVASGIDLRAVRVFRLLRLARALKMVRYSKAINRFARAFRMIREELVVFFMACLFVLFVASTGIYYFENPAQPEAFSSILHCLWWSVATLTTVGYGDIYPITVAGRVFTFAILMIGLGIVAVPAGLIATAMSEAIKQEKASEKMIT
jgi:voltage-gated potassium channel